jgi:hypothetical protein
MPLDESLVQSNHDLVHSLSQEFAGLYSRWCSLIEACTTDTIYKELPGLANRTLLPSVGETVLRSAAVVEQTCGGITSNLWDDPFEWTLPETLSTREKVIEYLGEVEETRRRAFISLRGDADLSRDIAMPSGKLQSLGSLLLETLTRANQLQGQAVLTAKILSSGNSSRFII